jgi:hypothetical protein
VTLRAGCHRQPRTRPGIASLTDISDKSDLHRETAHLVAVDSPDMHAFTPG